MEQYKMYGPQPLTHAYHVLRRDVYTTYLKVDRVHYSAIDVRIYAFIVYCN